MLKDQSEFLDRIIVDPEIMAGKPVVRGTRIPVDLVLTRLSQDLDLNTLIEAYPRLSPDDIKACLAYAGRQIAGEDVLDAHVEQLARFIVVTERGIRIR